MAPLPFNVYHNGTQINYFPITPDIISMTDQAFTIGFAYFMRAGFAWALLLGTLIFGVFLVRSLERRKIR